MCWFRVDRGESLHFSCILSLNRVVTDLLLIFHHRGLERIWGWGGGGGMCIEDAYISFVYWNLNSDSYGLLKDRRQKAISI